MTIQQAKQLGYTHAGTQFGFIPVFFKDVVGEFDCMETIGKNKFYDILLDVFIAIDMLFGTNYSFEIWLNENPL